MSRSEWIRIVILAVYPLLCLGFDPSQEFILGADDDNAVIAVFDLNGNVVDTIDVGAEGYIVPLDVTFDYVQQRVFFTDGELAVVASMNVDGSDIKEHGSAVWSYGVAIDSSTNTLYWGDTEGEEKLSSISLCPGGSEQKILTGEKDMWDVEVYKGVIVLGANVVSASTSVVNYMTSDEKLYWIDSVYKHLARASLDGSDFEILRGDLPGFVGDVVVTPHLLLWSTFREDILAVRRDNLDGPIETFAAYDGYLNSLHHQNRGLRCVVENPSSETPETAVVYGLPNFPGIDVCFQKSDDTGNDVPLPSSIAKNVGHSSWGKYLAIFKPPRCPAQRFGVYSCAFSGGSIDSDIRAVVRSRGKGTALSPVDGRLTKTASVKDEVTIAVRRPNGGYCNRLVRWTKDGILRSEWSGKTHVTIKEATMKDEGIYEVFLRGRRTRNRQTTILLYIRACEAGTFGPECSGTCVCKNGGHCDAITGSCICPPGFRGGACEVVDSTARPYCARVFGPGYGKCQGLLFCLRGKFGCTCAAGYHGLDCDKQCRPGTYGASCTQRCPRGECCDRFGPTYSCP